MYNTNQSQSSSLHNIVWIVSGNIYIMAKTAVISMNIMFVYIGVLSSDLNTLILISIYFQEYIMSSKSNSDTYVVHPLSRYVYS